jgi:hypothetical protein
MKKKLFLVVMFLVLSVLISGCIDGLPTLPADTNQQLRANFTAVITTKAVDPQYVYYVVHFDASSSNGNIINYNWNFKDSDPNMLANTGNGKIIDRHFSFSGNYNIELTVIDSKGSTNSIVKTITLLPDDSVFIAIIEELNTPKKIGDYMVKKFTYELHDPGCQDIYILWKTKKGVCADFANFGVTIADYHGYETYSIAVNNGTSHALGVYVEDGKYTYSSNQYYSGKKFNTFKEILNDYSNTWNSYCVWNHDNERVEQSPNY